jgi:protein-S-isoprenylcysteine O-methyltransferase Ste14
MLSIPPPFWAIIFLATLYYLSDLAMFADLPSWQHKPAGVIVLLIGMTSSFTAMAQFFIARTQILPTSPTNNKLVIAGIYRVTRNPMYLGLTIASLGVATWFGRPLMFLAPLLMFAVANWVFIPYEEAKMHRQFGDEFDAYTKRVRRWI